MSRQVRYTVFGLGLLGLAVLLAIGVSGLPRFGTQHHPYGDRAVAASIRQQTANTISSVNFDQRGIDTLGEEFILFAAALGASVLLRPGRKEHRDEDEDNDPDDGRRVGQTLDAVQLFGYLALPTSLLVGWYVVAHGALSPGGGFQGGVVLATGLHFTYLARNYRALAELRPIDTFEVTEAIGAGTYAVLGFATLFASGAFLVNSLPHGTFNALASSGTVPLLNAAVGLEVASAMILVLAVFFDQTLVLREEAA